MAYRIRPLPLRSPIFWQWAVVAMLAGLLLIGWESGFFAAWIWSPPRPPVGKGEIAFSMVLVALLGVVAGLIGARLREGSCPRGVRRAAGVASALGALSLLCPVCLALPLSLFGGAVTLALLSPFAPLFQLLAILVLLWTALLLLHEQR